MENHFTEADIMVIEKEISCKTYTAIAFLLDKPVEELTSFLNHWLPGRGIIPYQLVPDKKRPVKIRKPRAKKEKKKDPLIISRVIQKEQKVRRDRNGQPIFRTKKVDLSQMKEVKIDRKTWIYVKPGTDPIEAKENYLMRLRQFKSRMLTNEN